MKRSQWLYDFNETLCRYCFKVPKKIVDRFRTYLMIRLFEQVDWYDDHYLWLTMTFVSSNGTGDGIEFSVISSVSFPNSWLKNAIPFAPISMWTLTGSPLTLMSICFRVLLFLEGYINKFGINRFGMLSDWAKVRVYLKLHKMPKLLLKIVLKKSTLTFLSEIRVLTAR